MLRGWGITFIIAGVFWALAGFATYASDIQLGIAVGGLNLLGIGILMWGIDEKLESVAQSQGDRDPQ
jgi:hypothetical protein